VPGRGDPVLIVALSARALAASAAAAGFRPVALDAFGDLDLREVAVAWARIPVGADWRLSRAALLAAARTLAPPTCPLVYGSGFERDPATLAALARGRPLWGTPPERLRRAKDPFHLARVCRRLGLPHPEVRRTPPADPAGWLVKRRGAAGGAHVRPAAGARPRPDRYFQRRMPGRPCSVLVAGDGRRARALGFAWQRTRPGGFRFRGVTVPRAPPRGSERLFAAAETLAAALGLVGLGSVDFLRHGTRFWVLELNPRPTAALDAFETACDLRLFPLHLAACRGRLPTVLRPRRAAASEIVFAPTTLRLPDEFRWPEGCRDRTPPGTPVPAGAPLCTLLATGPDAAAAEEDLERRRAALYRGIAARVPHDEP